MKSKSDTLNELFENAYLDEDSLSIRTVMGEVDVELIKIYTFNSLFCNEGKECSSTITSLMNLEKRVNKEIFKLLKKTYGRPRRGQSGGVSNLKPKNVKRRTFK